MRISTIVILLVLIGGGLFVANKMGYIGQAGEAVENSFTTHFQKGQAQFSQSKYKEAIAELERALALDNQHDKAPECMKRIADCYREMGAADSAMNARAVEWYQKTAETYPDSDVAGRARQEAEKTAALGHH